MKKLELKKPISFVCAVLVTGFKQQDAIEVDGVTLQSCTISYLPARGDSFVTTNVGSDLSTYGSNTANLLLSTKKELNELLPLKGKICIVSGNVKYYADKKAEIYKPVLQVLEIVTADKETVKFTVKKGEVQTLQSFDNETEALKVLQPKSENLGKKKDETQQKAIFETLGKTQLEWDALDIAMRTTLAEAYISEKTLKGIGAKAIMDAAKA